MYTISGGAIGSTRVGTTPVLLIHPYLYCGVHFTDENSAMNQRLGKIPRVLLVCLFVSAVVYCYCINADRGSSPRLPVVSVKRATFSGNKKLLYLLQTESCLPLHLRLVDVMGNTSICKCDVLVLSYNITCNDTLSLPHVEYIFNSSTTWTTGRNLLHEVAMLRRETYLYYIFLDDDIVLFGIQETTLNLWRKLEDSLRKMEPAVAALLVWGDKQKCINAQKRFYEAKQKQKCSFNRTTGFLPVVGWDAAFSAFHYQSVNYILPYSSRFDTISWHYSQVYVNIMCEIMFQGQVLLHTDVCAVNPRHGSYPRGQGQRHQHGSIMNAIVNEIKEKIPKEYRTKLSSLMLGWKTKEYHVHATTSSTFCLPPPTPHKPIKPYAHLVD